MPVGVVTDQRISPLEVLLIEDDEDDYRTVRDLFPEPAVTKLRPHRTKSYEAALGAIRARKFDLCLPDYVLDHKNGLEFPQEITRGGSCPPIIFLCGHDDQKLDLEVMRTGGTDLLTRDQFNVPLPRRSAGSTSRPSSEVSRTRL